jgi:hypothetical protein
MMHYRSYRRLDSKQRIAARSIAKSGILSGNESLDEAARAWSRDTVGASLALVIVFVGFGLTALLTRRIYVGSALLTAAAVNAAMSVYRYNRLRVIIPKRQRRKLRSE